MLKLMYITKDPAVARIAERAGVDRVFVDLETVGKDKRQGGMNTVQSDHTLEDVAVIRSVLTKAELLVRVNPIYPGSEAEINTAIANGADILMLPFFQTAEQVRGFLKFAGGRVKTMLLFETPESVENMDEILALPGIDECFVGLNDLHLGYGRRFMFELLADGTVERIAEKFKTAGVPFGFGGIARIGTGTLPAERILGEHVRMGSKAVILSRSFCNTALITSLPDVEEIFMTEVPKLRQAEMALQEKDAAFLRENQMQVQNIIGEIVEAMG